MSCGLRVDCCLFQFIQIANFKLGISVRTARAHRYQWDGLILAECSTIDCESMIFFFFPFKQRDLNDFWKVWVNSNGWFNVGLNMQHASASYCKASKTSKIVLFINFILYLHNYFAISSINYSSFVRNDIAVERRIYAYWKITVEMRIFLFCLLSEQNVFFFYLSFVCLILRTAHQVPFAHNLFFPIFFFIDIK